MLSTIPEPLLPDKLSISGKPHCSRVLQHHYSGQPWDSSLFPLDGTLTGPIYPSCEHVCTSTRHTPPHPPSGSGTWACPAVWGQLLGGSDLPSDTWPGLVSVHTCSLAVCQSHYQQRPAVPPLDARLTHPSPYLTPAGMPGGVYRHTLEARLWIGAPRSPHHLGNRSPGHSRCSTQSSVCSLRSPPAK